MKRHILLLAVIVLSIFTILSCTPAELEVPVDRVSINQPTAEMEIGETIQLNATVSPSNATHKEITWSSSKKSVASVSDAGLVTALAEGNTIIYATADGKTAECAITVSKRYVEVTAISLNKEVLSLVEGDSETLVATVKPDDATDKTVSWSTSEASVATVDQTGKVGAIAEGTATITATAGGKKVSCAVSVSKRFIAVSSISLDKASASLKVGETLTLTATVKPDDATDKMVSWSTSDATVATVDNGVASAIKVGTVTITAKAGDITATCVITVVPTPVASVTLDKTSASLKVGETLSLTATVKPDDATDKTVSWSTSDAAVATVDNGLVTANKAGSATISAKAGDMEATCSVTVEEDIPITFADAAAKYACVEKFDTNGDGEVSLKEAEAATSFDGLFTNWRGVKSFDEIKYFKNVHSLNSVFYDCNKLVSIIIPDNITDLGTYAFSECSSLTSVVLPSGINEIGNNSFQNCSSLGSIDIPSNVTIIGGFAFSGCSSFTDINLPSHLTTIGNGAFQNCRSLTVISIPESVSLIGSYAFSGCNLLSEINLPSRLTTIADHTFDGCGSLTAISIPEGVTSIGAWAFGSVDMWKIELPSSISSLESCCFAGIFCVILPSTSPVSVKSDTFALVGGIFVPSNMIDLYSAMTNWTNYSLRLHPINSYKEKNEYKLATSGVVDMGTSVKWAAFNLGATNPEEIGDYYAWGETQTKTNYTWSTYKWSNGGENKLTKYCDKAAYWDGTETLDGKTVLELVDDAARANWGGTWRMPTKTEFSELVERCFCEWTTYEGITGLIFYGVESGKKIFFPASGYREGNRHYGKGGIFYWSSSLDTDNFPSRAWYLRDEGGVYISDRTAGFPIRPVAE